MSSLPPLPPSSANWTAIQMLCHACDLARAALQPVSRKPVSFKPVSRKQRSYKTQKPIKPYPCPHKTCPKRFARIYNLNAHQRVHNKEMPYQCHICAKRFRWRSSLTSHVKFHQKTQMETTVINTTQHIHQPQTTPQHPIHQVT